MGAGLVGLSVRPPETPPRAGGRGKVAGSGGPTGHDGEVATSTPRQETRRKHQGAQAPTFTFQAKGSNVF